MLYYSVKRIDKLVVEQIKLDLLIETQKIRQIIKLWSVFLVHVG